MGRRQSARVLVQPFPGSSPDDPPFWKSSRSWPWGRGWQNSYFTDLIVLFDRFHVTIDCFKGTIIWNSCSIKIWLYIDPLRFCSDSFKGYITYILLTKREGRTGRISARGLDSTDRAQRVPYKKDRGPIFSQYSSEQDWLIRDLLHDWRKKRLQRRNRFAIANDLVV